MPVVARTLNATEVAAISTPGTHAVGGVTGLCLQVTATGARSWLLRISIDSRRREFGLGAYPTVTLAFARDQARALRATIGGGVDPSIQRRFASASLHAVKVNVLTFKACAEAFAGVELSAGRNARYVNNTLANLQRVAFPLIGALRVDMVAPEHVLGVIGPIWGRQQATATKVRGSIERVIAFAIEKGYREAPNPARWTNNLDKALAAPKGARGTDHHAALPVDDLAAFMADLRSMPGVAARALEFMVLTATRPSDVRTVKWPEIDLAGAAWNIAVDDGATNPATVAIPLVDQTVRILQTLARGSAHQNVFASPRTGRALSDMALTAVIRRMNEQRRQQGKCPWVDPDRDAAHVVPSGLRTTFRAWASLNKERYVAAAALLRRTPSALPPGSTVLHQRTEADRRTLLEWARFCSQSHHV